jgi:hypothetical protein
MLFEMRSRVVDMASVSIRHERVQLIQHGLHILVELSQRMGTNKRRRCRLHERLHGLPESKDFISCKRKLIIARNQWFIEGWVRLQLQQLRERAP